MPALLGLAAMAVAIALLARFLRRRAQESASPGSSIARAVAVANFSEIDAFVENLRCSCDGGYQMRGEGPVASGEPIRVARVECRECGRERSIHFDVSATRVPIPSKLD